ncbi:MAG: hypothetical protein ACREB3_00810 [Burkholderiales bacterium]
MADQHALINGSSGAIKVAPDPVHGSKKNKDQVVWLGTTPFEVIFDLISPFSADHFVSSPCRPSWARVTKKGAAARGAYAHCAQSGPIESGAALGGYKYTVKMAGLPDLDPGVHVDR